MKNKKIKRMNDRLEEIAALENNWDGCGSEAICYAAICRAKKFIELTGPSENEFNIYPTCRNSVQFEMDDGDLYIEAEIFHDKIVFSAG